ncbi:MAG: nucleotidyltransferase domain-containing protein [Alphaproteobacteria bacterium]
MNRRFAILDDNDRLLHARVESLADTLPAAVGERACAAMLVGSVAEGRARDDSDLDVLLVLRSGTPRRADYAWWDERIAPAVAFGDGRFPVQPLFVSRGSLRTCDESLRHALDAGLPLWDPEGLFGDES